MLSIALPIVFTYLGFTTMTLVDLICVGHVGATAIGAVGVGTSTFSWFMVFGIGLLTSLDYLISHAYGAGKKVEAHQFFNQGVITAVILGVPLTLLLLILANHLEWLGINPEVRPEATAYLSVLSLSLITIYVFTACRQYMQARGVVKPAFFILLIANLLNAATNWVLVFGHFGFPAMGAVGSAWATLGSRIWMMLSLLAYAWWHDRQTDRLFESVPFRYVRDSMNKLWKLGIASSLQMLFEVGVFALSTNIAAHLTTQALAAHQIVLNIATFTFMVPMGLGSATAVLVGQSMGREDFEGARKVGWKGLALGIGYMALASLAILVFADPLLGFFTIDPTVAGLGKQIILIAALFQISDGTQTVATGALRGLANTRTPMIANLVGHWLIGLPVGLVLAFGFHWGLPGLWTGLSVGLTVVAVWLMARWIGHWSRRPGLSHATP